MKMSTAFIVLCFVTQIISGEFEPDPTLLDTLNIDLVPAPGLSLSEAFGALFPDISDFDSFDVQDNFEVLASGFVWTESPVYVEDMGLFWSDVYVDTLGKIYFWDEQTLEISVFLDKSGIVASQDNDWLDRFRDISNWGELGSNGLFLSDKKKKPRSRGRRDRSKSSGKSDKSSLSLFVAQHGNGQIVEVSLDFEELCDIEVIVGKYEGVRLNAPNDLTLSADENTLWFTDPPFGLRRLDGDLFDIYDRRTLDFCGVYKYDLKTEELFLFDVMPGPNGIAISDDGKYAMIGNSANSSALMPYWRIYYYDGDLNCVDEAESVDQVTDIFFDENVWTSFFPDFNLVDGLTYFEDSLFLCTGPSGVYIIDAASAQILGRITVADLVSNVEIAFPYLYMALPSHIVRVCLQQSC